MKLPFFLRHQRLSEDEIRKAMDELRTLRIEVAVAELERTSSFQCTSAAPQGSVWLSADVQAVGKEVKRGSCEATASARPENRS